jgi:stage V sporulation protein B
VVFVDLLEVREEYIKAKRLGQKEVKELRVQGKPEEPFVLDEILGENFTLSTQDIGYVNVPVVNMLSSGVVRLVLVYVMVGNPNLGLMGAPIGAFIGYLLIAVLNLVAIRRKVEQKPRLLANLLRPAMPALVMGVVVFFCYKALVALMGMDGSRVILAGVPIAVGAAVYFVCVVLMKSITKEDCLLLPKGEKIAKLLKL